ncbi:MAG: DegT/DnrJ/EryC1/StrS family aminotransferase [Mycobacterium sp.]
MNRINVMKPWLGVEEVAALSSVIASGWIAQGPRVAEFESEFARTMRAEHAVALSNCTTALHISLVLAGIGPGDDVVVPSLSFIATANAVVYTGARPVFADVDAATGNVTADTISAALTPATRAIIAVDQGGVPVDLVSIRHVCDRLGIVVIEDAACGAGSRYRGEPVGVRADITVWSFHPRKILTTGEGGMLTTDDAAWADRARLLREHGMSVGAAERHRSILPPAEQFLEVGYNYRMTDLQAAVGLVQLSKLDKVIGRRRELAAVYQRSLGEVAGLRCVTDPVDGESNYQSFWVEVGADYPLEREQLLEKLAAAEISARRGIMAAHRQPAYSGRDCGGAALQITEHLTDHTLILPLYHELTDAQQQRVIDVLVQC